MEYLHGGDIEAYSQENMLDYSVNIHPFGPCPEVVEAVIRSVRTQTSRYPDPFCRKLRKRLANRWEIPEKSLILGNGAAELIFLLVQTLRPKKGFLIAPSFAEYRRALESVKCEIRWFELEEEKEFRLTKDYLNGLTEDLEIAFLCSPDNPSGQRIPEKLLDQIIEKCEKQKIFLVLDESFLEFTEQGRRWSKCAWAAEHPGILVLRSFTKIQGIPGLRLGYGVSGDSRLAEAMEGKRQPWSVSTVAQAAGIASLEYGEEWAYKARNLIREEKPRLEATLEKSGMKVYPGDADFLFFRGREDLQERLLGKGILIRDCSDYPGLSKGYFRIAVKKPEENERLIQALEEIGKEDNG